MIFSKVLETLQYYWRYEQEITIEDIGYHKINLIDLVTHLEGFLSGILRLLQFFTSLPVFYAPCPCTTTTAAIVNACRLCHCTAALLLFCCVFFKIPENFSKCDISKSTSCRLVAALKSPAFIWRDFLLEKAFQGFFKMPFTYGESKIPAQKLNDSGSDVPEIRVKTVFNG